MNTDITRLPLIKDPRGNLAFVQHGDALPFAMERCYWISDVPGDARRDGRALRTTSEMIIAVSGSFDVKIDDGHGHSHVVSLRRGYQGLLIDPMTWREIVNFSTNAVALVISSSVFDEGDYIRDYEEFIGLAATEGKVEVLSDFDPVVVVPRDDPHPNSRLADCTLVYPEVHDDPNGKLAVMESGYNSPFPIERVFYLFDVPSGATRGGHSHFEDQQIIVALSGSFTVTIDDGTERRDVTLSRPDCGLYIPAGIWRELKDFSAGSVCLVLTSAPYEEADYVRSYEKFRELTSPKRSVQSGLKYPFLDLAAVNAPYLKEMEEATLSVMRSGRYIGGDVVAEFENMLAQLTGARYAVGVSNGLDALRLIFRAYIELGRLAPGDEVIVPANTYIATVLAVSDSGMIPVLCEPDEDTMNLDARCAEKLITPRTRAILPVHLYGRPCWDEDLKALAEKHQLIVVEDNAQAIGATAATAGFGGFHTTGALGHAAAFSFYPTKNIGAMGDAGAVTTDDAELAQCVRALANYGSDRRYHNIYKGLNCRLDPVQAAVLIVKLRHLIAETFHRRRLAKIYNETITNPAVRLPIIDDPDGSVWHQYVVRVENRDALRERLTSLGIGTDVNYPLPPHLQPCYKEFSNKHFPIAERISQTCVSLPLNSAVSESDAREIATIINRL